MSRYANKWRKITRTRYMNLWKMYDEIYKLNVYSSFTNPEETIRFGEPRIMTSWGNHKIELLKGDTRNYREKNEYTEWYEAIGWEKLDG
jgi:hypothetical protein